MSHNEAKEHTPGRLNELFTDLTEHLKMIPMSVSCTFV